MILIKTFFRNRGEGAQRFFTIQKSSPFLFWLLITISIGVGPSNELYKIIFRLTYRAWNMDGLKIK